MSNVSRLQDLKGTEHFRHWRQEEVAKIVQCGEHYSLVVEQEATREMPSSLIRTLFHILLETKFPGSRCDHLRPRRAFFWQPLAPDLRLPRDPLVTRPGV